MEEKKKVMEELGILPVNEENINTDISSSMYKEHLSLLIVRGRSKEYLGKNFSLSDLDQMPPKELERYYKLYEAKQFAKINESFTHFVINGYTKVCELLIKPEQKQLKKLNNELKNDYLVTNQLEQWTSYFSYKLGGLMPLISASMITFDNLYPTEKHNPENENINLDILNGENDRDDRSKTGEPNDRSKTGESGEPDTSKSESKTSRKHKETKNSKTN